MIAFKVEYARDSHGDLAQQAARTRTNIAAAPIEPRKVITENAGTDLATRAGCLACHGIVTGIVGPSFADVARRYRGDAGAAVKLMRKVQDGGAGSFGSTAMPPQLAPIDDIRAIIDWILNRLQ